MAFVTESPEVHAAQVEAARSIFVLKGEDWENRLAHVLWPDAWLVQEPPSNGTEVRVLVAGEAITVPQPDEENDAT